MRAKITGKIAELAVARAATSKEVARMNDTLTELVEWLQQEYLVPSDAGLSVWVRAEDLRKLAPAIRKGAASIAEQADFAEQRIGGVIGSAAADSLRKDAADMNSLAAFVANLTPADRKARSVEGTNHK